ncbi:hypothetical protein ACFQAT_00120 [Undibacterium arcticum]|uniref:hypothetical protein n=1 Tax=Undibacterium arcticum TaxID=1762892 RepID=UPI00360C9563
MAQRSKMAPERIRHRIACQHLRASLPGLMLRGERGSIAQNKASAARISMGNKNTVSSIFIAGYCVAAVSGAMQVHSLICGCATLRN